MKKVHQQFSNVDGSRYQATEQILNTFMLSPRCLEIRLDNFFPYVYYYCYREA